MSNTINVVIELSQKLLNEVDNKMLEIIYSEKSDEIYITAPQVIISLFQKVLVLPNQLKDASLQMHKLDWLIGINIFPSVDWAITMYHKDYSLYKHNWMIRKVSLTHPVKVKEGNQSKEIIYLNQLINSAPERVELN